MKLAPFSGLSATTLLLALTVLLSGCFTDSASAQKFSTDDERNTAEVFSASSPSVVYVTNQAVVRDRYTLNAHAVPQGTGTGVVWDSNGYIITNYHVVEGAGQILITLQDQTSWPATVVGLAPSKDLAVLHIDAPKDELRPLPLGNSSDLAVGRKVMAIGNPFGLDTTLTVGVVSAVGREIKASNQRTIRNVIQTDAAINPGNSGGPLINSSGELVGINTAIYSPSGTSVGIGFAIPVNTVKTIVPMLIEDGRLTRPSLGVEIGPSQWARSYGMKGVPVLRVSPGSPADRAGINGIKVNSVGTAVLGDVLVGLGNFQIDDYDDLLSALEAHKAGDKVTVQLIRDGKTLERQLVLADPVD